MDWIGFGSMYMDGRVSATHTTQMVAWDIHIREFPEVEI
jgi:hypothetical protein